MQVYCSHRIFKKLSCFFISISVFTGSSLLLADEGQEQLHARVDLPLLTGYYYSEIDPRQFEYHSSKDPVLNDPTMLLHGFFLDHTKLKSIFEHGLLSFDELMKRNIIPSMVYGIDDPDGHLSGYCNGRNQISLSSVYLMGNNKPCFDLEGAMTLVIQGIEMHSGGNGCTQGPEVRVNDRIAPEYFGGLIVSRSVLNRPINEIDFMAGYFNNSSHEADKMIVNSKIQYLRDEFSIEDPELNEIWNVIQHPRYGLTSAGFKEVCQMINRLICKGFEQKMGRPQHLITFWHVIQPLLPVDFPIYDENGFLIEGIWNQQSCELQG